ncbi:MAG: plastocyanin/azurin family copper-binding protein [Salinivenus sp.]
MADSTQSERSDSVSRRRFLRSLGMAGVIGTGATFLAACGGGSDSSDSSSDSESGGSGETEGSDVSDGTVTLHPKGNEMEFEETEFTVPPGEEIELVFENTASSPSMKHNVVILDSTEDEVFERVGKAGSKAGAEEDYVTDDDAILAHTPMSDPGETVSVTFTTPDEEGEYGYVCTYPGHWATMRGTMRVRES